MKQFFNEMFIDFLKDAFKYMAIPVLSFLGFYALVNYIFG